MIKQLVLTGAVALTATLTSVAQTQVYTSENLGELNGVSANGKFAAITDSEMGYAYLWSLDNPTQFVDITIRQENASSLPSSQRVVGCASYGVADDGMVVGSITYRDGNIVPAIYRNGEWEVLPYHESSLYIKEAVAVTADGKYIAGCQFIKDETSEIAGRYYPCRWVLGDDGEYTLEAYTDIKLPAHQGFIPTGMTPDGSTIFGRVYCGVGSTLPAYVKDGEFVMMGEITEKSEPWIYEGKYYCGRDEEGTQIWSDDPNDPRIVLFTETYIDGVHDTGDESSAFSGTFTNCDWYGNLYGNRTYATDVNPEEGTGNLHHVASIYNLEDKTWTDGANGCIYYAGIKDKYLFTGGTGLLVDGKATTVTEEFDFQSNRTFVGVNRISQDGRVLGAMTSTVCPATGEPLYYPFMIVLEQPLDEVDGVVEIAGTPDSAVIITSAGRIDVANASEIAIYDLGGNLVSAAATTSVAPGIYVVKADSTVKKVMVK